jgi:hypothetical protein
MNEKKVYKVRHTLIRAGRNVGHFESDLIFEKDIPFIVIEWEDTLTSSNPIVKVQLDPKYLHKLNWKTVDYLYEYPIEDPREIV